MQFTIKRISFDLIDVCVLAAPLVAAVILTFLITFQTNICLTNCFQDGERFIVMSRNCYLKIP